MLIAPKQLTAGLGELCRRTALLPGIESVNPLLLQPSCFNLVVVGLQSHFEAHKLCFGIQSNL